MRSIAERLTRYLPASLFGRLALVLSAALLAAHIVGAGLSHLDIFDFEATKVGEHLAKDTGVLVQQLEISGPALRSAWLDKMQRKSYRFSLGPVDAAGLVMDAKLLQAKRKRELLADLSQELGTGYPLAVLAGATPDEEMRLRLLLRDGTPLTIQVFKLRFPVSWWGGALFVSQVLIMLAFIWLGVRQATRPLQALAEAAERLGQGLGQCVGTSLQGAAIAEDGPTEVARAAAAFNAMQQRITDHLAERVQLLAAISHDLQTPITRMRLRADLLDDALLRDKLGRDLDAMQAMVEEGIAYARSAQSVNEAACRVDLGALLDSLVCDYVDAGHSVQLGGELKAVLVTRPHTLRRMVVNLLDNALKFGQDVEVWVDQPSAEALCISVRDRGPGIPPDQLAAVLQPFYRVESSRNRSTGGTGLGLAIAQQLSAALGARFSLANRDGGGLEAQIILPLSLE
ncbi:ATP-binding protein [Roseateles oligotrophus]|uniref:histidine kinase n=1 Tax=Roseateles oligotrophus TaxID=1769250 RepID=A0ABT2YGR5_9BURK|nr:ATP-binding protein [Roseateles oligotrophus]MCV2369175.1 HAMP domain-containing protein [Roseateles oligotrophus]